MTRTLKPAGPDFEPDGRLYGEGRYNVVAYGLTGTGDEVVVRPRMYNTIITIGPAGSRGYREHW